MTTVDITEENPRFPLSWVLATGTEMAPLVIRVMLGVVLFPHGAQKLLGWFGGYGFDGTMSFFTETVHLPYSVGLSVILIEFLTPFLLILGLATRPAALLVSILFIGIILASHVPNGFFMNWEGNQPGEGFEYHLLVLGMAVSLIVSGGGRASVDSRLPR